METIIVFKVDFDPYFGVKSTYDSHSNSYGEKALYSLVMVPLNVLTSLFYVALRQEELLRLSSIPLYIPCYIHFKLVIFY